MAEFLDLSLLCNKFALQPVSSTFVVQVQKQKCMHLYSYLYLNTSNIRPTPNFGPTPNIEPTPNFRPTPKFYRPTQTFDPRRPRTHEPTQFSRLLKTLAFVFLIYNSSKFLLILLVLSFTALIQLKRFSCEFPHRFQLFSGSCNNYLFKVSNRNTSKKFKMCAKLTIKTHERRR